jgi:cell division inhibitor SulA
MRFRIKASPYQFVIFFVMGETPRQAKRWLRSFGIPPHEIDEMEGHASSSGVQAAVFYGLSGGDVVLWMQKKPDTARWTALLAHELHHAVSYIMRIVGIPPTQDTEEAHAYLLQDLMQQVLTRVWR